MSGNTRLRVIINRTGRCIRSKVTYIVVEGWPWLRDAAAIHDETKKRLKTKAESRHIIYSIDGYCLLRIGFLPRPLGDNSSDEGIRGEKEAGENGCGGEG